MNNLLDINMDFQFPDPHMESMNKEFATKLDLENKAVDIARLRGRIGWLEREFRQEIKQLREEIHDKYQLSVQCEDRIDALEAKVQQEVEQQDNRTESINCLEDEVAAGVQDGTDSQEEMSVLEAKYKTCLDKIDALEESLEDAVAEISKYKMRVERLKSKGHEGVDMEGDQGSGQEMCSNAGVSGNDNAGGAMDRKRVEKICPVCGHLEEYETDIDDSKRQIEDLKNENKALNSEIESLQDQSDDLQYYNYELREQLQALDDDVAYWKFE